VVEIELTRANEKCAKELISSVSRSVARPYFNQLKSHSDCLILIIFGLKSLSENNDTSGMEQLTFQ